MLTYAQYLGRRYFEELDGIRAISVLLVFTVHQDYEGEFWRSLNGGAGVSIFFVLSGFLITTLALREEAKLGRLRLGSFYLRRAFRIYPLYLAVLAIYVVMVLVLNMQPGRRSVFLDALPGYLLFFPEWTLLHRDLPVAPPFAGAWSLGIEEKFYFLWPMLAFVLLAWKFAPRVAAALALAVLATGSFVLGDAALIIQPYALIALGCVVALLLHSPVWFERVKLLGHPWALAASGALLAAAQFGTHLILPGYPLYVPYGVLAAVVLAGIVVNDGRVVAWLQWRPLVFLGTISYAFYLTHGFGINAASRLVPPDTLPVSFVTAGVGLAAAVLIAWLMHITVEKPMIRVGHHLAGRSKRARELPAVAA